MDLPVVPAPLLVTATGGAPFDPRAGLRVVLPAGPEPVPDEVRALARRLADDLAALAGLPVAVSTTDSTIGGTGDAGGTGGTVELRLVPPAELGLPAGTPLDAGPGTADPTGVRAAEAHRLDVRAGRATLSATTAAGLRHAATTLRQLVAAGPAVPACTIVDAPRYPWRGLALDVARHFVDVPTVEAVLDVMATLKLRVLHLHLTDDQGWRLDVPSRPQLTARSGHTAVDGDPAGFYTAADWDRLLAAAAARGVELVPEIDVPGHVNAAQHALPELNPTGEAAAVHTGIEVGFSQLHAALPATGGFLRDVLSDVAAMTPGGYVHIGGDEALTMQPGEYGEIVALAAAAVRNAGKTVVGWQEIAKVPLEPGTVVQWWDEREGAEHVAAAARAGALVLLSPATHAYLDLKYHPGFPLGLEWAGHVELRDAHGWEPADAVPGLPAERITGVEACLWTETVRTPDDVFLMLLPRLAAVAEVAWSAPDRRGWDGFTARVATLARGWDAAGLPWYRSPQVSWHDNA
ncbi:family 20 glycosylhydrolase [Kineococcus glutinatus]|uniref:beta-N-acetylhexosaminidase n=1 Tax=Kineococcus glutinatus TaxID=1070872 RepID=A0ABP9I792_9ACTN